MLAATAEFSAIALVAGLLVAATATLVLATKLKKRK
jgi:hypothetical protein